MESLEKVRFLSEGGVNDKCFSESAAFNWAVFNRGCCSLEELRCSSPVVAWINIANLSRVRLLVASYAWLKQNPMLSKYKIIIILKNGNHFRNFHRSMAFQFRAALGQHGNNAFLLLSEGICTENPWAWLFRH